MKDIKSVKNELQNIINGKGNPGQSNSIQTAKAYLRNNKEAGGKIERAKPGRAEEERALIKYAANNDTLITKNSIGIYITEGAEQKPFDMTEAYVKSELHKGIMTIEFFHPQSNSLPKKILHDLAAAITHAGEDPNTIVIILRSAGENLPAGKAGVFCAGASFDELAAIKTQEEGLKFFSGFAHVINAMRTCPKFIIGRIHGKCVGGGVGLAASVDYAISTEGADVKLSELAVGIGPFVVGPAVERKIGASAFSLLAIDATMWRNADWARGKGLFAELHSTIEAMDESVRRLANVLVHSSPEAMAEMKKIFWAGTEHWDKLLIERAAISGRLILSDFTKDAIEKIKAPKPPKEA